MIHELYHDNVFFLPAQLPLLMVSCVIGAVVGILLASDRALQHSLPKMRPVCCFFDSVVIITAYCLLFSASLDLNTGILRWYDAIAFFLGLRIVYLAAKHPAAFITEQILRIVRRVICIIVRPIRLCLSEVWKMMMLLQKEWKRMTAAIRVNSFYRLRLRDAGHGFCTTQYK